MTINQKAYICNIEKMDTNGNMNDTFLNKYRAKRVKFFINGDKYFRGINYALNTEKIRSFEYLLNDLNRLLNGQSIALIKGVRCIFSSLGNCILNLNDFEGGQAYFCSSTENFIQTDYPLTNGALDWQIKNSACINPSRAFKKEYNFSSAYNRRTHVDKVINTSARSTQSATKKTLKPALNISKPNNNHLNDGTEKARASPTRVDGNKSMENKSKTPTSNKINCKPSTPRVRDLSNRRVASPNELKNSIISPQITTNINSKQSSQKQNSNDLQSKSSSISSNSAIQIAISNSELQTGDPTNNNTRNDEVKSRSLTSRSNQQVLTDQSHQKIEDANDSVKTALPHDILDKYDVGSIIGDGHFSVVYCCMDKGTKQFYALKVMDKIKWQSSNMIYNEMKLLRRLEHPNIVKFIEEFDNTDYLYLVLELVQNGDLFDAITSVTKFNEIDVSTMIHNLSSALAYLHEEGIVHRDIKAENLLVYTQEDGSQSLKLADFGLAIEVGQEPLLKVCGTAFYVSPEMLNETGYSFKVDVWSSGVMCYILLCGYPPFTSENESNQDELFDAILAGEFSFDSQAWNKVSHHAKSLIKSMLTVDPEKRYTAEQVFHHPWTRGESSNFEGINPLNMSRLAALRKHL